tara:strand:- start:965 stop:1168 length:204 start_codon:yes stop_codon:yes gene_type:complete
MSGGSNLNKKESSGANRGFELMLRHRSRKEEAPKLFDYKVDKTLSLFGKEIRFLFNLQMNSRKKSSL